ncbi:hypothetical protein VP236O401_P0051 [Vibrio phage 236O40-1]|nr:hypothetical protein VP236O401_P0051 [Vibrio phage 236O40-1]
MSKFEKKAPLLFVADIQDMIEKNSTERNPTDKMSPAAWAIHRKIESEINHDEIKPGSVVKLASGGRVTMTVESEHDKDETKVWVCWFADLDFKTTLISKAALVLHKEKE